MLAVPREIFTTGFRLVQGSISGKKKSLRCADGIRLTSEKVSTILLRTETGKHDG
jgi:hypothetical protein